MLAYFFKRALENVRLSPFLSLVTLSTIAISLMILGLFGLIYLNFQHVLRHWGDELQICVYLNDTLSPEEGEDLGRQIAAWPAVEKAAYVSKSQALARFRSQLHEYAGLLDGLKDNPLPASLELKLESSFARLTSMEQLVSRLQNLRGVTDVQYGKLWLARLKVFLDVLKLVGITIGGLLFLATVFVISNTVKLTFYSRREELEIMRLVGATDTFIKTPFIIEGLLHGFMGALLAAGALVFLMRFLLSHLNLPLRLAMMPGGMPLLPLISGFLGLGLLLGTLGSAVSLRRFVRS